MTELTRAAAIARFAGPNADYYMRHIERIGDSQTRTISINWAAVLGGPLWMGVRRLWNVIWPFFVFELIAWIIIAIALGGSANAEAESRITRLEQMTITRQAEADAATQADPDSVVTKSLVQSVVALQKALDGARADFAAGGDAAPGLLATGIAALLAIRLTLGLLANGFLEKRFRRWRLRHSEGEAGSEFSLASAAAAAALALLVIPLAAWHFAGRDAGWLSTLPADPQWHTALARGLDTSLSQFSLAIRPVAQTVISGLDRVLSLLENGLTQTPWPIVATVILALAWQLAGPRIFVLTFVALAYLGLLGFWEKSMQTIALLGTAAVLSVLIGLPLGIFSGYNKRFAAVLRPVLDFMQTMPAFVYLIPVIALFGIGKPSGIIATVIFGIPPVVRLTALGIAGVPQTVRESAQAFGASAWFILRRIDLPLAMPSIRAGISQSILMCLSMVVIAALIGAKGLGEDVLRSLQYASQGQGLLAGLAILLCAVVLDRVVQGRSGQT